MKCIRKTIRIIPIMASCSVASGAKRYTYNSAGNLIQVEAHNGTSWATQATMS